MENKDKSNRFGGYIISIIGWGGLVYLATGGLFMLLGFEANDLSSWEIVKELAKFTVLVAIAIFFVRTGQKQIDGDPNIDNQSK